MKKCLLISAASLLLMMSAQVQAAQITITGTVTDANGSVPFSVTVTTDQVSVTSATVAPAVAPLGTTRTLTIVGNSSASLPLSFTVAPQAGITFTPVAGQPPNQAQFTFVY